MKNRPLNSCRVRVSQKSRSGLPYRPKSGRRGLVASLCDSLNVICDQQDALIYCKYIKYLSESAPGLSRAELERKFNGAAWRLIWGSDPGFASVLNGGVFDLV
jgi:hypothetical protein